MDTWIDPIRCFDLASHPADRAGSLILDPIVSAIQGDSHMNAEVRRGLQPIVDFAAATDAAVIGTTHLSKGTGGRDPVDQITGSLALGAVTQLAFLVAREDAGKAGPTAESSHGPRATSVLTAAASTMTSRQWSCRAILAAAEACGISVERFRRDLIVIDDKFLSEPSLRDGDDHKPADD